jgi:hypothetical protein
VSVIQAIIQSIDEVISAKVFTTINQLRGGIATRVSTTISDVQYIVPCKRGTEQILVPDDNYSVISYHNLEGIKPNTNYKDGVGDDPLTTNTYNCSLVVFANCKKLETTPEELALHIQCVMPSILNTSSKILPCGVIRVNEVNLDALQLHQIEYPKVEFRLTADHCLIKIKYQIESELNTACFNKCA